MVLTKQQLVLLKTTVENNY